MQKTRTSLTLTWSKGHDGFSEITGYVVRYKEAAESTWSTKPLNSSAETTYTVTGLKAFTEYEFQVAARNGIGISDYSGVLREATYPLGKCV